MLANLQHNVSLWLKEKTGLTAAVVIFGCITAVAALMGIIFSMCQRLCLGSGRAWPCFRRACVSRCVSGDCGV